MRPLPLAHGALLALLAVLITGGLQAQPAGVQPLVQPAPGVTLTLGRMRKVLPKGNVRPPTGIETPSNVVVEGAPETVILPPLNTQGVSCGMANRPRYRRPVAEPPTHSCQSSASTSS